MKRIAFVSLILLASFLTHKTGQTALFAPAAPVIDPGLANNLSTLQPGQTADVIVTLGDQLDLRSISGATQAEKQANLVRGLQSLAGRSQASLVAYLADQQKAGKVKGFTPLWIIDAIAVSGDRETLEALARLPGVKSITTDAVIQGPASPSTSLSSSTGTPAQNLSVINVPALWNLGYQGQGIVVASMDTGVDVTHPDLNAGWRGGTNSWYDPYGQHPTTPVDLNGHGTWTMGIMVGGGASGTILGVAPQAQWIAVKIFNDSNMATTSAIHQGFQWLLDPDANPLTNDAPNVVNNSWDLGAPGCNLTFEPDIQALVTGNITVVFSAGNQGPNSPSDLSPANNPNSFSVGATDNNDLIASFSSRGPTSCGQNAPATYPDVSAPGVAITTTDLYGFYTSASGTSFSAPHVSGAVALLLNAVPGLSVSQLHIALTSTAKDLGGPGADNTYGAGRIDVLAAYNAAASGNLPTATPTPTALPTATPTFTPVPTATATPQPTLTPAPTSIIFTDGFEAGNLSAWTATGGAASLLKVSKTAAQSGSYGMAAQIQKGASGYVVDGSPAGETIYHARFYFNPNGAGLGTTPQTILAGLNTANQAVFSVQVRKSGGSYQINVGVSRSGGATSTNWYAISNAFHAIEIVWQSGASASFSLYLDGTLMQTMTGLNTSAYTIDAVRLGPSAGLSGSPGSEYFDNFASSRTNVIGP